MSLVVPGPGELADLSHIGPVELREDPSAQLVADELFRAIERRIVEHPRSQQVEIGPSEIGTACGRQLVYRMAAVPPARDRGAPWLPTIGTAVHDWLGETLILDNVERGWSRWLIEAKVNAGAINGYGDLEGSGDVYDRLTGSVVDWKIVGDSKLKEYRTAPRAEYKVQPHVYGLGFARRGLPVRRVVLMLLPRNKDSVRQGVVWSEPYDAEVATRAIRRAERVNTLRVHLGLERALTITNGELRDAGAGLLADPRGTSDELAVPVADDCRFCSYLRAASPGSTPDLTRACPGVAPGADAGRAKPTAADVLRGPASV